jgi:hypothetical protein
MKTLHYREGERLLRAYTAEKGLRTLDALQLAVALLELHRESRLDQFVCADEVLSAVNTIKNKGHSDNEREKPRHQKATYTPPDLGARNPTTYYAYYRDRPLTQLTRPAG